VSARTDRQRLVALVPATLSEILAVPQDEVFPSVPGTLDVDLMVSTPGLTFVIHVVGTCSAGLVADRSQRVGHAAKALGEGAIPVVAVPFMTGAGKQACERTAVSWFDFSGNAHLIGPGIRVIIDGRPNRFRTRGRSENVFAPKGSRVARYLLMHSDESVIQRELARATDMSEGFVSRIVGRLAAERYVERDDGGGLRVKDRRLLLEAWRDRYRFEKHDVIQGHVAARSGEALARLVGDELKTRALVHAATGLAAAWQLTRFVAFRIATFFVDAEPSDALKEALGFREEARGANLWFVVPNDAGVFMGAEDRDGVLCAHPLQVYLDLKGHPERSAEAAERLRSELLKS